MEMKLINRGDEGEVLLIGRLDSITSGEAEEVLDGLGDRFDSLILNMEQLEYISSAGLRVMKKMHMKMKKKNGKLILKKVAPMVMEVLFKRDERRRNVNEEIYKIISAGRNTSVHFPATLFSGKYKKCKSC